jgi:hypothetical protein
MTTPVGPNSQGPIPPQPSAQDSPKAYSSQESSAMNNTWFKHWFPSASEQDCKAFMANMMKALQVTIQQDARMAHRAYEHMKRVIEGQD